MRTLLLGFMSGVILAVLVAGYGGRNTATAVNVRAVSDRSRATLSVPCTYISPTVIGCQLMGHGFAPLEPIRITYTLMIPVRAELAPIIPAPKLWGLEPPRVQCLTNKRDACVRYHTSDQGFFGPLLVHLTYLKLPGAGGATGQNFWITVYGSTGDQASALAPYIRVVH